MYSSIDYLVGGSYSPLPDSGYMKQYEMISQPVDYSPLERITVYSSPEILTEQKAGQSYSELAGYENTMYLPNVQVPSDDYISRATNVNYVQPDVFLNSERPVSRFIDSTDDVRELAEEAFEKVTGENLDNVTVKVCSKEEMKELHGKWQPGILGFSVNFGIGNMVFVQQDTLERLLITIGHELGHIFTRPLNNKHDEEAKAFAFEFAWVNAIRDNDIGGLAGSLNPHTPAENGLHDVAFNFVAGEIKRGKEPMGVFQDLVKGNKMVMV